MIYTDKAQEQVFDILYLYKEAYLEAFGEVPSNEEMAFRFKQILAEKKDKDFRSRFDTFSPKNLIMCIEKCQEPDKIELSPMGQMYQEINQTIEPEKAEKPNAKRKVKSK